MFFSGHPAASQGGTYCPFLPRHIHGNSEINCLKELTAKTLPTTEATSPAQEGSMLCPVLSPGIARLGAEASARRDNQADPPRSQRGKQERSGTVELLSFLLSLRFHFTG